MASLAAQSGLWPPSARRSFCARHAPCVWRSRTGTGQRVSMTYRIPERCQTRTRSCDPASRMKLRRLLKVCLAATPAGVGGLRFGYRGCRYAQPPANGWHPCGTICAAPAGGLAAISRGGGALRRHRRTTIPKPTASWREASPDAMPSTYLSLHYHIVFATKVSERTNCRRMSMSICEM